MVTSETRKPAYRNPLSLKSVSQCTLCPALGRDHVPSVGAIDADLFIVGQSPGVVEVDRGEPFVGPAGALLNLMLEAGEIDRSECWIANALKCQPPTNRPAAPDELVTCFNAWLKYEIGKVNPKIILILGKDAAKSLRLPEKEQVHGNTIQTKARKYIFSYHPAYFLRQNTPLEFVKFGTFVKEQLEETDE